MPSAISKEKLTVHLALVINLNISFPSETNAAMELSRVLCAKRCPCLRRYFLRDGRT